METRLPRAPARTLLAGALATLLFAGALRAFLSSVYYHNLTTLGLNATALFALLLLAPLLYLAPRPLAQPQPVALGAGILLVAGRLAMAPTAGVPHLVAAGLAAASFLVLLPALLRLARGEAGDDGPPALAAGLALGWALDGALLAAFASADPTAGTRGLLLVLPLGALLAWLLTQARPVDAWPAEPGPLPARWRVLLAGLAVGAWLFLEHALLAAPHAVARWGDHPLPLALLGSLGGLLAGVLLLARAPARPALPVAALALGVVGLLDHSLVHSPLAPLLLGATQAALVLLLGTLAAHLSRATLRRAGASLAAGAFVLLVLHFAWAFAFQYAYVPLGAFWHDAERWIGPLALLLVLLGALATGGSLLRAPRLRAFPRRATALPAILVLLAPTAALALPAAPIETPPPDAPITILAFNLHQGFRNTGVLDPDLYVDVIRALDADVVALQESSTTRFTSGNLDLVTLLAQRLGYHAHHGAPAHEQGVGVALLSRYPIEDATVHRLPSTKDDRYHLEARLDVHGQDLWIYAVHLGLPAEDRLAQTDALLTRAALHAPRILAGDFNSCPGGLCPDYDGASDDVYARLTRDHADAWAAAGGAVDDSAAWTYSAQEPTHRIDYVFVSDGITVEHAETVRTAPAVAASDHLPVRATVRIG